MLEIGLVVRIEIEMEFALGRCIKPSHINFKSSSLEVDEGGR